jgi:hypothetical protein
MFAYEIPGLSSGATLPQEPESESSFKYNYMDKAHSTLVVYNFHSILTQDRFFLFVYSAVFLMKTKQLSVSSFIDSITELFPAAN